MDGRCADLDAHIAAEAVTHSTERQAAIVVQVLLELAHDIHSHLDAAHAHTATLLGGSAVVQNRAPGGGHWQIIVGGRELSVPTLAKTSNDALLGKFAVLCFAW